MMGRVDLSLATCNASTHVHTSACQLSKRAAHLPIHNPRPIFFAKSAGLVTPVLNKRLFISGNKVQQSRWLFPGKFPANFHLVKANRSTLWYPSPSKLPGY